jgi:hypothetical protein
MPLARKSQARPALLAPCPVAAEARALHGRECSPRTSGRRAVAKREARAEDVGEVSACVLEQW